MPHVLDDTDSLEHPSPSSAHVHHDRSRMRRASGRGHRTLFAMLRSILLPLRRVHHTRVQRRCFRTPQGLEMSMDTLAWQYPDIYLRITSWSS